MSRGQWDKWTCILLFISRDAFVIPYVISTQVTFMYIPEISDITLKCIVIIWLSYVITIEAEIVHAIEGKGQKNEFIVMVDEDDDNDENYENDENDENDENTKDNDRKSMAYYRKLQIWNLYPLIYNVCIINFL
ncbi:hypothetical protein C1646_751372 [Rhizophagus diaphanus]|nr:hypothetical protein C1646_751372 [Rhizophagus diaphanus] [Rhizophagus sp. MUCL 43196]